MSRRKGRTGSSEGLASGSAARAAGPAALRPDNTSAKTSQWAGSRLLPAAPRKAMNITTRLQLPRGHAPVLRLSRQPARRHDHRATCSWTGDGGERCARSGCLVSVPAGGCSCKSLSATNGVHDSRVADVATPTRRWGARRGGPGDPSPTHSATVAADADQGTLTATGVRVIGTGNCHWLIRFTCLYVKGARIIADAVSSW